MKRIWVTRLRHGLRLLLLVCFLMPLFWGCSAKAPPKEFLENTLQVYSRAPDVTIPVDAGLRPVGNHPFKNCFSVSSLYQLQNTQGVNSLRFQKGNLRVYDDAFFKANDLLILIVDHPVYPVEYQVDGILYNENSQKYDLHITQTFYGESEIVSELALVIEVEKGMFPEGIEPYFPEIVYTPYRG